MHDEVLDHRFWERWNKLEGKSLVARFAQADLLVQVCGWPPEGHTNDGSRALMEAIAERAGYHVRTLASWRTTAARVTESSRDDCVRLGISWKTLQMVADSEKWKRALPRLIAAAEKGKPWTVTETGKQLGHATPSRDKMADRPTAREVFKDATVEEKARIIQDIAKESPEVLKDAASDLATRVALTQSVAAHHKEADAVTEKRDRERPGFQSDAEVEAENALYNAKNWVGTAARELAKIDGPPSDAARQSIAYVAHKVRDQLDNVIAFLEEGGGLDEDALNEMLREGS